MMKIRVKCHTCGRGTYDAFFCFFFCTIFCDNIDIIDTYRLYV